MKIVVGYMARRHCNIPRLKREGEKTLEQCQLQITKINNEEVAGVIKTGAQTANVNIPIDEDGDLMIGKAHCSLCNRLMPLPCKHAFALALHLLQEAAGATREDSNLSAATTSTF